MLELTEKFIGTCVVQVPVPVKALLASGVDMEAKSGVGSPRREFLVFRGDFDEMHFCIALCFCRHGLCYQVGLGRNRRESCRRCRAAVLRAW